MKIETIRLREEDASVTLTALLHEDSQEFSPGRKRPAVLVCPGGGYCYCSDREAEPVAVRFAGLGYQTFVLRYTTAGMDPKTRRTSIQTLALQDLAKAVLTIRAHAEEWLVDANSLVLCGFSAGGHLCGSFCTHWQEPALAESLGVQPEALRPSGAILVYALLDCEVTERFHAARQAGFLTGDCNLAVFGTATPTQEQQQALSPCNFVSESTPPTLLIHAANDFLVPCENSLHYAEALVQHNVPCELHLMEGGSHGFALADASTSTYPGETNPQTAAWSALAADWLRRHAPLSLQTDSNFTPPDRASGVMPPPPPASV